MSIIIDTLTILKFYDISNIVNVIYYHNQLLLHHPTTPYPDLLHLIIPYYPSLTYYTYTLNYYLYPNILHIYPTILHPTISYYTLPYYPTTPTLTYYTYPSLQDDRLLQNYQRLVDANAINTEMVNFII